jgi:SH3 domain-containing YSC84-like protein 1
MTFRALALAALAVATVATAAAQPRYSRDSLATRLTTLEYSLEQVMENPETAAPAALIQQAKAIVVTHAYRGGLIIGGKGGFGALFARQANGQWSVPVFVEVGEASIGFQAGAREINTIYLIMDNATVEKLYSGRFVIGTTASAVAGPLVAETASRSQSPAPMLVYSSTRGLFAGATASGGWLKPDDSVNRFFYSTTFTMPEIIFSNWFSLPPEAQGLAGRLRHYERTGGAVAKR